MGATISPAKNTNIAGGTYPMGVDRLGTHVTYSTIGMIFQGIGYEDVNVEDYGGTFLIDDWIHHLTVALDDLYDIPDWDDEVPRYDPHSEIVGRWGPQLLTQAIIGRNMEGCTHVTWG